MLGLMVSIKERCKDVKTWRAAHLMTRCHKLSR